MQNKSQSLEKTFLLLGKLLDQILSMELILRLFLDRHNAMNSGNDFSSKDYFDWFFELTKNDSVDDRWLSRSNETLSKLIIEYNQTVTTGDYDKKFVVDKSIVELRNAISHGRVASRPDRPPRLVNFRSNKVIFVADLSEEWLTTQYKFAHDQTSKIAKALVHIKQIS